MKIDLIGMILNNAGRRCFDGAIIDTKTGKALDAAHSLDHMIMEYAKVRNGGESSTVVVSRVFLPAPIEPPQPKENQMENQADMLIKISNLETAIELLPDDADRANILIKAENLRVAIECAGCE